MCRTVYLTSRRFDGLSRSLVSDIRRELETMGVKVRVGYARDIFNLLRPHRNYDIAVGIDFHRDEGSGGSLVLNKLCTPIGRDFAYNLSDAVDRAMPKTLWRDFEYVHSNEPLWRKFFHRVSSQTKCLFYICTATNPSEIDDYKATKEDIVRQFAEQIALLVRSDMCRCEYNKLSKKNKRENKKPKCCIDDE